MTRERPDKKPASSGSSRNEPDFLGTAARRATASRAAVPILQGVRREIASMQSRIRQFPRPPRHRSSIDHGAMRPEDVPLVPPNVPCREFSAAFCVGAQRPSACSASAVGPREEPYAARQSYGTSNVLVFVLARPPASRTVSVTVRGPA